MPAPTVFQQCCLVTTAAQGASFLPQKDLMNSPYLLAEVLETVELLHRIGCPLAWTLRPATEPSGTYQGKAGKGLGTETATQSG